MPHRTVICDWPLLDSAPWLPVTAVDILDRRVEDILAVQCGGIAQVTAVRADATHLPFPDRHFDRVTALEVLEHIPDANRAVAEIARVAQRGVVLSVPSHPDDNPEHIHLFDAPMLTGMLKQAGIERANISHVHNHLIVVGMRQS
jgi:ubiquinone/menaquinone biosynthesis C-methylase UbiE